MFCRNCGTPVAEGGKFCLNCGNPVLAVESLASPPPGEPERKKKGGAAFFSSPAGIALIVVLSALVIAGIVIGVFFILRGGPDNTVDAETVEVWDEYESILENNSENVPQITMDQTALVKTQEDLKKTQERVAALEKVLKETGGTQERRTRSTNRRSNNARDIKADQMAAALAAYNLYIQKMNELFTTLVGANLLDQTVVTRLNQILAELQKLGAGVKVLSNKFLANNDRVVTIKIDPPILKMAAVAAPELQKSVDGAVAAEQQRLEAERQAAEASAAAAAAEAERQRQAEAERQAATRTVWGPIVSNPCGDTSCQICYGWITVQD